MNKALSDIPAFERGGCAGIRACVAANHLLLSNMTDVLQGMVAGVQSLRIDTTAICSDFVLAEAVVYKSADKMCRETGTLTLKKATYGEFEASMTSIPKYCFRMSGVTGVVLVHAVPKVTLDTILQVCEREYLRAYLVNRALFYSDWLKEIRARSARQTPSGSLRLLGMCGRIVTSLYPAPVSISRRERRSFAAQVLNTVVEHHAKGIYHDTITAKTVFFPTLHQPQFLANYAGIPSVVLSEYLPEELVADDAPARFGPACRDVYALALLCYRIVSGVTLDGRLFSVSSPRPLRLVLEEIATQTSLSVSCTSLTAIRYSVLSVGAMLKECCRRLPLLYSSALNWRELNSATGLVWRCLPVVGPVAAVLLPTPCARVLRQTLDRHWFYRYLLQKGTVDVEGPSLLLLLAAFKRRTRRHFPGFKVALKMLGSKLTIKRQVFGSLMETRSGSAYRRRAGFYLKVLLGAIGIVAVGIGLFLTVVSLPPGDQPLQTAVVARGDERRLQKIEPAPIVLRPLQRDSNMAVVTTRKDMIAHVNERSGDRSPLPKETPRVIKRAVSRTGRNAPSQPQQRKKRSPVQMQIRKPTGDTTTHHPAARVDSSLIPKPVTRPDPRLVLRADQQNTTVYVVTGSGVPCNPADLIRISGLQGESGSVIALLVDRLFIAHAGTDGFGAIVPLYLCRLGECDNTLYFEAVGLNKRGAPAIVRSGDVISASSYQLRRYLRTRRLGKK